MEGKKMLKSFKRLAAAFLIAVFIIGSLNVTSAEAAIPKPGNARFDQWNNDSFTSCDIYWNPVEGASQYEIRVCWTDGSHASYDIISSRYTGYRLSGLSNKHVYVFTVRAIKGGEYGKWSNMVFITPWPYKKDISASLSGSKNVKLKWKIIGGSNGYNVFMTTNPSGKWYWNLSTNTLATSTSATIKKYRGKSLQKYQNYYVRVVTRRKFKGVFCEVPEPSRSYYSFRFYIYTSYK